MGMSSIPMATQAAGANNNVGGIGALSSPWGGSGMDLNYASRILDPFGISGNGGMNKGAAEAFFDPAGLDSGAYGLNLFGQRGNQNGQNASGITTLPNLGAQSMVPTMPGGSFGASNFGGGPFNAMANQSAGQIFTPNVQTLPSATGAKPGTINPSMNNQVSQTGQFLGNIGNRTQPYRGNLRKY